MSCKRIHVCEFLWTAEIWLPAEVRLKEMAREAEILRMRASAWMRMKVLSMPCDLPATYLPMRQTCCVPAHVGIHITQMIFLSGPMYAPEYKHLRRAALSDADEAMLPEHSKQFCNLCMEEDATHSIHFRRIVDELIRMSSMPLVDE